MKIHNKTIKYYKIDFYKWAEMIPTFFLEFLRQHEVWRKEKDCLIKSWSTLNTGGRPR